MFRNDIFLLFFLFSVVVYGVFLFVVLNVETFLNWEMSPVVKTSVPLPSPTFPIPGSGDVQKASPVVCKEQQSPPSSFSQQQEEAAPCDEPEMAEETKESVGGESQAKEDEKEDENEETKTVLFYTPDEEEATEGKAEEGLEKYENVEGTSYVPPFNNPVYPNTNFTAYGSVIGKCVIVSCFWELLKYWNVCVW